MKGSFFIKAKTKSIITDKGVRAFIMERLLNSPFSKGAVLNIDDKTVQVQLEGDERQIKFFVKELEKDIIAKFGNPTISFTSFQEDCSLEIPDLLRASQALMVGQLEKGINVQLDILKVLKGVDNSMDGLQGSMGGVKNSLNGNKDSLDGVKDSVKDVHGSINEVKNSVGEVNDSLVGVQDNVKEVNSSLIGIKDILKNLPVEIAKAMK